MLNLMCESMFFCMAQLQRHTVDIRGYVFEHPVQNPSIKVGQDKLIIFLVFFSIPVCKRYFSV